MATAIQSLNAYRGRRILVTGHTGFKGGWLSLWLASLGAEVVGISDAVPTEPSLFGTANVGGCVRDVRADIRDLEAIRKIVADERPELIFHLAAQPLVRRALVDPYETVSTNVMGTLAVLEAARSVPGVKGVVVITSDKVYRDRPIGPAYMEDDALGGHEPYGASKAAAEIITEVYSHASFHRGASSINAMTVITARAGNVIGGGDWAANRLIPDIVRAIGAGENVTLRYPNATRPWQHVLEPLGGYLRLGLAVLGNVQMPRCINFGPTDRQPLPVIDVVSLFLAEWSGTATRVVIDEDKTGVEAATLQVNSNLAKAVLGWQALWSAPRAVAETALWYRAWSTGGDMAELTAQQIQTYTLEWNDRAGLAENAA